MTSASPIGKVEVSLGNGAFTALPPTAWGTYAKSMPVPAGTQVVFRATSSANGQTAVSATTTW